MGTRAHHAQCAESVRISLTGSVSSCRAHCWRCRGPRWARQGKRGHRTLQLRPARRPPSRASSPPTLCHRCKPLAARARVHVYAHITRREGAGGQHPPTRGSGRGHVRVALGRALSPSGEKPGTAPWRSAQRLLPRPAPTKLLGAGGGSERPRRRGGRPPPFLFRAPPACGLGPILRPRPSPTAPTSRQQDPEPPAGCVTGRLLPLRTSPATNGVGPRCPGTGRANAAAAGHDRSGYRELHC